VLGHPLVNRLKLHIRLRDGNARREPRDRGEIVVVVAGELLRGERDRHPQFLAVCGDVERRRHDANDGVRNAVQTNLPAQDRGIGAEAPRPQPMAENDHAGLTWSVF